MTSHLKYEWRSLCTVAPKQTEPWMKDARMVDPHLSDCFIAGSTVDGDSRWNGYFLFRPQNIELLFLDLQPAFLCFLEPPILARVRLAALVDPKWNRFVNARFAAGAESGYRNVTPL